MFPNKTIRAASICSALIGAQFIAGIATRDAVFLGYFDTSALPLMTIGTAGCSLFLVGISANALRSSSPQRYVPGAFMANSVLLLGIWILGYTQPGASSTLLYLCVSAVGPMLASGFWLIASEQFDPRTAKRRFGQMGAAGTVGGVGGGLAAAQISASLGAETAVPFLALLSVVCAWQLRRLTQLAPRLSQGPDQSLTVPRPRFALRVLLDTSYMRNLAVVVFLGAITATLADYVFKVHVTATLADPGHLGAFFAWYYAALRALTFVLQIVVTPLVLAKLGLSAPMMAPSLVLAGGAAAALVQPGFAAVAGMHGSRTVFSGSLRDSAYELFYTAIPRGDKRAVKAIIDVGVDRAGLVVGAAVIQAALAALPTTAINPLLWLIVACSIMAAAIASRLGAGYVRALEINLIKQLVDLESTDIQDWHTRTVVVRTTQVPVATSRVHSGPFTSAMLGRTDAIIADIRGLRSDDASVVRRVLRRKTPLSPELVPQVVSLLERDDVAPEAIRALRVGADAHVRQLVDALLHWRLPFVVRRRLPRVLSVCTSQQAANGLLLGLQDNRFEVRVQCGRVLTEIVEANRSVSIDPSYVINVIKAELRVKPRVWQNQSLVDTLERGNDEQSSIEPMNTRRPNASLAHIFNLLALILPSQSVRAAYHGLSSIDPHNRGTALEYLHGALPAAIRDLLWPYLDEDLTVT